jgi:hypothetical protein
MKLPTVSHQAPKREFHDRRGRKSKPQQVAHTMRHSFPNLAEGSVMRNRRHLGELFRKPALQRKTESTKAMSCRIMFT